LRKRQYLPYGWRATFILEARLIKMIYWYKAARGMVKMLSGKIKLIFLILGPLFILAALYGKLPPTVSFVLMSFGIAQIFMLLFKGGG
jgi:hypothetical protein